MSGSNTSRGFGSGSFRGLPTPGQSLSDAVDQVRAMFEERVWSKAGHVEHGSHHGDVRSAILALLAERPMRGQEIIAEIGERSDGLWKPSPGAVYPMLQLLSDEGLVRGDVEDGRKAYALTDAGRSEARNFADRAPWNISGQRDRLGMMALPKAGLDLAAAAGQVQRTGSAEQVKEAVAVLDEARRKLYSILAQD